ncbi:MAG: ATP synthase protein I [Cocleimonas sp.]|jgi:ATP synthase protein I
MTVVTKLSLMQFVFILLLTALITLIWDLQYAGSAFLGGFICVIANLFFAGKLFLSKRYVRPEQILQKFYRSEVLKLLFTFTMFVVVFVLIDIKFAAFILAYSFTTLLNLLCLPFLKD